MRTIVKNGTIVTTEALYQADILIEGECISSIAGRIEPGPGDRVIDASGRYILPGGIDVHTHLANTDKNDFDTGSIAAAVGGTTSLINMTAPQPGQTAIDYLNEWKEKAAGSVIDFGFHYIVSGTGYHPALLEEIPVLVEQGGITSLKIFMAYKGDTMVSDAQMYAILKKAAEWDLIVAIHAENGDVIDELVKEYVSKGKTEPIYHAKTRPPELEAEAVRRAVAIAEVTGARIYIVHLSCAPALEEVRRAKRKGVPVTGESCPQYLVLDEDYLRLPDFESGKYVCSPPLREKWNRDALWRGINEGLISVIGSDHCSYDFDGQKTLGRHNFAEIPNGVPGIEDRFAILYHYGVHEGRISLQKFVEIISTKPAETFGLETKGSITVGKDADLVVLDPNRSRKITKREQHQANDYNLYEGTEVYGVLTHVFSRGELIVQNGQYIGAPNRGRYLHRTNGRREAAQWTAAAALKM